jgi:hypothetical protein
LPYHGEDRRGGQRCGRRFDQSFRRAPYGVLGWRATCRWHFGPSMRKTCGHSNI